MNGIKVCSQPDSHTQVGEQTIEETINNNEAANSKRTNTHTSKQTSQPRKRRYYSFLLRSRGRKACVCNQGLIGYICSPETFDIGKEFMDHNIRLT
jgi:hypothetical protein